MAKLVLVFIFLFSIVFQASAQDTTASGTSPYSSPSEAKGTTEAGSPHCETGQVCPQNTVGGDTAVRVGVYDERDPSSQVHKYLGGSDGKKPGSGTGKAVKEK